MIIRSSNSFAKLVKAIAISFDDGILSQHTNGKPILDKYDLKGLSTLFVIL